MIYNDLILICKILGLTTKLEVRQTFQTKLELII